MIRSLSLIIFLIPLAAMADTQCGPFTLTSSSDGFMHINGQRPESQKITFLREKDDFKNVKMQWMLPDQETGRYLGMDFIKRDGKAILNVEAVRMNMDEPRVFGTYDCVKAK